MMVGVDVQMIKIGAVLVCTEFIGEGFAEAN
jgi:hypothetical protein